MEFKDKLKALRKERGISQKALADAIFVSRSAVAKWENGLGLPAEDSMQALQEYFHVSADHFSTQEPEKVIVQKNRDILCRKICVILLIVTVSLAAVWYAAHTDSGMKLTVHLFQSPLQRHAQEQLSANPPRRYFWGYIVHTYPEADAVFYECNYGGYRGFFYSAGGEPVGFQGTEMEFYNAGNGHYYWYEGHGDNKMHVVHITGNWYWYEMYF